MKISSGTTFRLLLVGLLTGAFGFIAPVAIHAPSAFVLADGAPDTHLSAPKKKPARKVNKFTQSAFRDLSKYRLNQLFLAVIDKRTEEIKITGFSRSFSAQLLYAAQDNRRLVKKWIRDLGKLQKHKKRAKYIADERKKNRKFIKLLKDSIFRLEQKSRKDKSGGLKQAIKEEKVRLAIAKSARDLLSAWALQPMQGTK